MRLFCELTNFVNVYHWTAAATKITKIDLKQNSQSLKHSSFALDKSSKSFNPFEVFNNEGEDKVKKQQWKKESNSLNSNNKNSSTLSLHIAAYENSTEVASSDDAADDLNSEKESMKKEKRKNVKQIFATPSSAVVQNPFEFPRQQKDQTANNPEVMQFKASQKLSNLNATSSSNAQGSQQQQEQRSPLLQRQLSNGIKQPMNTVEACTIIDNTVQSLSRSLNMFAEKNNRPMVASAASTGQQQSQAAAVASVTSEDVGPEPSENSSIIIEAYKDETQMPCIMSVITKELSEPYSIYTYRFFIHNWPELCLLARDTTNNCNIGVIVCKLDHDPKWRRGYIAMLAVEQAYRRRGIGKMLVQKSIEVMREKGCDEVMLEAEVTNKSALILYDRLGFIRERRLYRYYLNGSDAFRLKLLFADCWPEERPLLRDSECDHSQCDHDHHQSHQNQQHRITEVA